MATLEQGTKHDNGKPQMDLISGIFLFGLARVLTFGAKKYTKYGACTCQQEPLCTVPEPKAHAATCAIHQIISTGTHNWRKGIKYARLYASLQRHLWAWWGGEENDPESGECHLDNAACCLMFLREMRETRKDLDDRYVRTYEKNN